MITCASDPACLLENAVAEKIGRQRYKLWFKNATRFTVTDESVCVEVPNLFIGDWIQKHFTNDIHECVENITGKRLELTFATDPTLAKQLRRKQPDTQLEYASSNPARMARRPRREQGEAQPPLQGKFEDFVVGESNRLAFTCAQAVAQNPAVQFNPLVIHGGCGIGKTHLLQAICNEMRQAHPAARWAYVSGEDFTNQFVYAVKCGEREAFRRRYRNLDMLVIDDIHFLANKRATQEEFLHTFNAIDSIGKQVVMASDAHPKLIGQLSESLITRFISGMVVKIDSPDYQTRIGVLRKRADKLAFDVPNEVLEYVASHFRANVRELEGALLKLVALARLSGQQLDMSLAIQGLDDMIEHTVPVVRLTDIESVVSIFFGVTPADLHTSRKTRTVALARGLAMYLARKHTAMSYPEIGRFMGNKNHSTVILATRRIAKIIDKNEEVIWMTPAGNKQANLREIIAKLEEQLATSARS